VSISAPTGPAELAEFYRLPLIDLRTEPVHTDAAESIPLHVLARTRALPYRIDEGHLKIAVADPANIQLTDELRIVSPYPIDLGVASAADIDAELHRLAHGNEPRSRAEMFGADALAGVENDDDDIVDLEADDGFSGVLPIQLVNSVILQASNEGASDVHFLPHGDSVLVRLRVDGILREIERIPKEHAAGVISRVKVLAKLDIAEHRMPQDGRISVRARSSGRLFDIRIAVLPTVEGEGVIMRLLEKTRRPPTLTEIGLSNELQMKLEAVVFRPTGAFLVTGPTGSGKSTTVYAALCDALRPEINVITIEDPVEYRLPDVYQLQVNNRTGLTFANGLRAILRADPDLLMVGEIRDLETAQIAIQAALTGHLVLSTVHTNSAAATIVRLLDLGVPDYLLTATVCCIVAQRLVRVLCRSCREPYQIGARQAEDIGLAPGSTLYRARGCDACRGSGYVGRIGLYEVMALGDGLRKAVHERVDGRELHGLALAGGMRSLYQDGIAKSVAGLTTLEEVWRVTADR
jgi:type II secretory ATPase GspE/PulE/Tfp pilus assembly ATPase PilB-like protein